MQIYPAIDIRGGRVVRYAERGPETVYATDPVAVAEALVGEGASWLHVVDLDRALATGADNDALVRRLAGIPGARVQVGGRLHAPDQLARALDLGAARAVVATGAAAGPGNFETIVAALDPARLAVAVDVRDGRLVDRGADRPLALAPEALVRRSAAAGVGVVVHRDLRRDGGLGGPDVDGAARLVGLGADIVAAGGVGAAAHLLAARDAGLAGIILGRALHERLLTLGEALACLA